MVDMMVSIYGEKTLPVDLRGHAEAYVPHQIDWLFAASSDGSGDGFDLHKQAACYVLRIQPSSLHEIDGMNPMAEASEVW